MNLPRSRRQPTRTTALGCRRARARRAPSCSCAAAPPDAAATAVAHATPHVPPPLPPHEASPLAGLARWDARSCAPAAAAMPRRGWNAFVGGWRRWQNMEGMGGGVRAPRRGAILQSPALHPVPPPCSRQKQTPRRPGAGERRLPPLAAEAVPGTLCFQKPAANASRALCRYGNGEQQPARTPNESGAVGLDSKSAAAAYDAAAPVGGGGGGV